MLRRTWVAWRLVWNPSSELLLLCLLSASTLGLVDQIVAQCWTLHTALVSNIQRKICPTLQLWIAKVLKSTKGQLFASLEWRVWQWIFSNRHFGETYENTQWGKSTYENTQWGKVNCSVSLEWVQLTDALWADIFILNCRYVHPICLWLISLLLFIVHSPRHVLPSLQCTADTDAHIASVCGGATMHYCYGRPGKSPGGPIALKQCRYPHPRVTAQCTCVFCILWCPSSLCVLYNLHFERW